MNPTWPRYYRTAHIVLTVVGMAGIVGLFLPFVWDVSPLLVIAEAELELWPIAAPGFLSILVFAGSVRWIISGSLSRPERVIGYAMGLGYVLTYLHFMISSFGLAGSEVLLQMLTPIPIVLLGTLGLVRNGRDGTARPFNPVLAMQTAYLANSVFCLWAFSTDGLQIGAYLILVASLAYLTQIVLVTVQPRVGKEGEQS